MKVSIIGAGIGGLTAGIAVEQAGFDVHIFEREAELKKIGAGLTLWANAIHALEQLGLGEELESYSIQTNTFGLYTQHGVRLSSTDIATLKHSVDIPSIVIHRADLQSILLQHFKGTVHYAKSLNTYEQRGNQIYLNIVDGSVDKTNLLIACDGIHSVVRKQMIPTAKPVYAGYTSFRGVIPFAHDKAEEKWGEAWGIGQRFGILPLTNGDIYWYATLNAQQGAILAPHQRQQALLERFKDWYKPVEEIIKSTPTESILQHDTYDIKPLDTWRDGRVVLLGDAAHVMTPNMGQGACQAIEDGVTLGKLFAGSSDVDAVLAHYERLRIPRSNQILKQSRNIGTVGQLDNKLLCYGRNKVVQYSPKRLQTNNILKLISHQI